MEVFTFVVGWIHVDNLHRIFIPHCWINTGQTPKGYAIMLKVWVSFLVLCFLLFYLGLYLKSGHYKLRAGRPLLVIQLSRVNKNKWAKTLFFLPIFVEIIFFTFQRPRLADLLRTSQVFIGLYNSKKNAGNCDWKVVPASQLEITYLMSVDYLILSWMWNYN